MNRETKLALGIAVAGMIGMAIYWFTPSEKGGHRSPKTYDPDNEQIILPKYDQHVYRNIPQVKRYLDELRALIAKGQAVIPLSDEELDAKGRKVQALLLKDPRFLSDVKEDGKLLHNDMMRISPAIISGLTKEDADVCRTHTCYQAEKYNFVTNTTTRAIVDTDTMKVLSVERYPRMQPDISLRLTRIAQAIALHAPEVRKELGFMPTRKDITMANVRGSMKESPCENTDHLCVAPTFADHAKARALWAVVDLTGMHLAAAKWAGLGKTTTPACISERTLQNRYIMEHYCQKDTVLEKNGWHIVYRLTGSDGLEIRDVTFKGKKVLRSAKIVDWHVSYKQEGADKVDMNEEVYIAGRRVEYVRGEDNSYYFGYNDAMGCPLFSTSVVLAFNGPQVRELKSGDGFMLTQDFRNPKWPMACNYRYENRFEFYNDGSFRVVGVNKGRGCGDRALYRPVMRIDMALDANESFYANQDGQWQLWEQEGVESAAGNRPKYLYKIVASNDPKNGYAIEPNRGQFHDQSRGDHANIFVTRFHEQEGDKDMLTLGSCCKTDEDGPERFVNGESIRSTDPVIWYVPHIHNDAKEGEEYCWADTRIGDDGNREIRIWPCTVGPKFTPLHNIKE